MVMVLRRKGLVCLRVILSVETLLAFKATLSRKAAAAAVLLVAQEAKYMTLGRALQVLLRFGGPQMTETQENFRQSGICIVNNEILPANQAPV